MTGSVMVMMASSVGSAQSFSGSLRNTSVATGLRSATFSLISDGTSTTGASPSGGSQSCGSWYAPAPTTGIGSNFWCKLTTSGSTNTNVTGSSVGSILALSGTCSWTFQNSSTNAEGTGTATVAIYTDSGGSNLVATGSVSWDVGYSP